VPTERVVAATAALAALEGRGLKVIVETAARPAAPPAEKSMELELVGLDRPGIVREISQLLAGQGVNVEELTTDRVSAPMSAEMLFQARAHVRVSPTTDVAGLRAELERLANDLVVEIKLT
jgi:glycine cleavage system regulatory protein